MTAPKVRADVVFRPVGEEWVVYDPAAGELHALNVTAALVWEMCDGETTREEMAAALGEVLSDAPPVTELGQHVDAALADFRARGLLA